MPEVLSALGMLIAFVLILYLAYAATKWLGKRQMIQGGGLGKNIRLIDRYMLGQDKSLCIVEVGGRLMLIGVSGQHIEKICDLDPERIHFTEKGSPASFSDIFQQTLGEKFKPGRKKKTQDSQEAPNE